MVKTFADRRTADLFAGKRVKRFEAFRRQAERRLNILNEAVTIYELMGMPSNGFEALGGDRKGRFSIRITEQWRICFRFENGDAYDVEIVDYHR